MLLFVAAVKVPPGVDDVVVDEDDDDCYSADAVVVVVVETVDVVWLLLKLVMVVVEAVMIVVDDFGDEDEQWVVMTWAGRRRRRKSMKGDKYCNVGGRMLSLKVKVLMERTAVEVAYVEVDRYRSESWKPCQDAGTGLCVSGEVTLMGRHHNGRAC